MAGELLAPFNVAAGLSHDGHSISWQADAVKGSRM
jgi:hypothetical protein